MEHSMKPTLQNSSSAAPISAGFDMIAVGQISAGTAPRSPFSVRLVEMYGPEWLRLLPQGGIVTLTLSGSDAKGTLIFGTLKVQRLLED